MGTRTARKAAFRLILALVTAALIAGCGDDEGDSGGGGGGGGDAGSEPIVLGFAVAKTGVGSQFDLPVIASAELAIDDINSKGGVLGRPLKAVIRDTKSEPEAGALAAQEVIDAGADFMLVSSDFDFGAPAANVAESQGMIAMSMGAESPKFGVDGIGPHAFTIGIAAGLRAAGAAQWGYETQGWRNAFGLVQDSYQFTLALNRGFEWTWDELGGTLVGKETFSAGDTSFASQVNAIKSASPQPDVIWLTGFLPEAPTLIKQIRAAGIDLPILSAESLGNEAWLPTVPGLSNVYSADAGNPSGEDPKEKFNDVMAGIRDKVGPDVSIFGLSVTGYSAVEALSLAMERAESTETEAVLAELEKFKEEELLLGPTTYTPETHINLTPRVIVNEIKDGSLVFKEEWDLTLEPPENVLLF